jgi:hypothetical protein
MDKFFDGILRIMAGICAFLFVIAVGSALLLFNAERRLFNPSLYLRALENQNFYERLPALAAETIASAPISDTPNSPSATLNLLPAENWEPLFSALLPADISQPVTEQAVRSVFDYLNDRSETAALSLVEFKAHLTGPAGTEAIIQVLRAQPNCTLEQIAQLTLENLFGQNSGFILCNPSDELLALFEPLVQAQLRTIAATVPDNVDLTPNAASAENPLQGLRTIRAILRFSPLLPLGLLFLITIFAVRDLKSWLRWWGVPLLLGGLFGLIIAAAISPLSQWAFSAYAAPRIPAFLPLSVTEIIRELISEVLAGLAAPIVFQSIALLIIGIIMLLATRIRKPITPPSEARDRFGETPDEKVP